jgi:hypothetical protein
MNPLLESSSMLLEISRRRISLRNEEINYAGNRESNVHYLRRLCTLSCSYYLLTSYYFSRWATFVNYIIILSYTLVYPIVLCLTRTAQD